MPVVSFRPDRLRALLGEDVPEEELRATIPMLGADLDDADGEEWSIEFFPDRPDLFTVEGLARALRAYLDIEPGLRTYEVDPPTTHIDVDKRLADVRPYIGGAWVRGVELDDESIQALMAVQEDLHWGLGARRSKVAIGVHDAGGIEGPFRYAAVEPDGIAFTPLVGPEERTSVGREMTPAEILAEHPKGQEYAPILEGHDRVPIILDAHDNVLSFPPIINGTITTVSASTTDLFIDTTGTDLPALSKVLAILVSSLAEAGGEVEQVEVRGPDSRVTPDLSPDEQALDVEAANAWLGLDLPAEGIADALRRMAYGADPDGAQVRVEVPAYRADILHAVDLYEDVAIGVGYDEIEPAQPTVPTTGRDLAWRRTQRRVRQVLTGLGFLETMSLTLTDPETAYEKTRREPTQRVELSNPVSEEQRLIRDALLPSLLHLLSLNTHRDLPQQLFETGSVVTPDATNQRRVAFVKAAAETGFTEAKGMAQALIEDGLDADFDVEEAADPAFVDGRAARVRVDGEDRGIVGEVHPEVLEAFELRVPVIAAELELP